MATVWRVVRFLSMRRRRRSRKRYLSRASSLTVACSSTSKGSTLQALRTSTSSAASSISPVGIFGFSVPSGRRPILPRTDDDPFGAELARGQERRGVLRVDDDLEKAGAVAQVEEVHAAVVAAGVNPAGHAHFAADGGRVRGFRRHGCAAGCSMRVRYSARFAERVRELARVRARRSGRPRSTRRGRRGAGTRARASAARAWCRRARPAPAGCSAAGARAPPPCSGSPERRDRSSITLATRPRMLRNSMPSISSLASRRRAQTVLSR